MDNNSLFKYTSEGITSSILNFENFEDISDEGKMLGLLFGGVAVTKYSGEQILQAHNYFVFQEFNEDERIFREFRAVQAILQNFKEDCQDSTSFSDSDVPNNITELLKSFDDVLDITGPEQMHNFDDFISEEFSLNEDNTKLLSMYFPYMKRQNKDFQSTLLFELTMFFFKCEISPTTAFLHLYRILELLSFNIPLVYTSKETNYIGAFKDLKKFFANNGEEFVFFKKFLNTLFKNEPEILRQNLEFIISGNKLESVKKDLDAIYALTKTNKKQEHETVWEFQIKENNVAECTISFLNLIDLMVNIRNRYFHLSDGSGNPNIKNKTYDMDQVFYNLNFSILNCLAIILLSVSKHSFSTYTRFFEL